LNKQVKNTAFLPTGQNYSLSQDIEDLELLLGSETDPIKYSRLKQDIQDLKILLS
jgi:hypothetical protein